MVQNISGYKLKQKTKGPTIFQSKKIITIDKKNGQIKDKICSNSDQSSKTNILKCILHFWKVLEDLSSSLLSLIIADEEFFCKEAAIFKMISSIFHRLSCSNQLLKQPREEKKLNLVDCL